MMLPRISAVLLFSEVSAVDWVSSVGWSADLGAGVAGSCFNFLCVPDFVNSCGSDAVLGINDI